MAFIDMDLAELEAYLPARDEPAGFDSFWADTLSEARAHPLDAVFEPYATPLTTLTVEDASFSGFGGQRIKAWMVRPAHATGPLPCVVEFVGYGGGRGLALDHLLWASAGFAHLLMDTRGQAGAWSVGETPDDGGASGSGPAHPGVMTRGVFAPETYYYRRLYTDAVRAVEAARAHPSVDPARVVVHGSSQGGGLAIAAAGLVGDLAGVVPHVPFLQHIRHATEITDAYPYKEIGNFCKVHRDRVDRIFRTLSYFDGVHFAARTQAPALYGVGLMDDICPPSTVYASFNHFAGPKDIRVYSYNEHDGGGMHFLSEALGFAARVTSHEPASEAAKQVKRAR